MGCGAVGGVEELECERCHLAVCTVIKDGSVLCPHCQHQIIRVPAAVKKEIVQSRSSASLSSAAPAAPTSSASQHALPVTAASSTSLGHQCAPRQQMVQCGGCGKPFATTGVGPGGVATCPHCNGGNVLPGATNPGPAMAYQLLLCGGCRAQFSAVGQPGSAVACTFCGRMNAMPGANNAGQAMPQQSVLCGGCRKQFTPTGVGPGGVATCIHCGGANVLPGANPAGPAMPLQQQVRCGGCHKEFNPTGQPGGVATCPHCGGTNALPAASAVPVQTPAATINVTCGFCFKVAQIPQCADGLIEFACPYCSNRNQLHVSLPQTSATQIDLPSWWKTKPPPGTNELSSASAAELEAVQHLVDETWREVATRDRPGGRGQEVPRLKVLQVQHNANPTLWSNYVRARQWVRSRMGSGEAVPTSTGEAVAKLAKPEVLGELDSVINEHLLFHGTKPSACESICRSDFMVRRSGSNAGMLYGPGVYLAENCSKSDEYAQDDQSGIFQGLFAMLICRVTCGRMLCTTELSPDVNQLVAKCTGPSAEYNCVCGDRKKAVGTYREFIVQNNDLVYPEYVIIYRREYKSGVESVA